MNQRSKQIAGMLCLAVVALLDNRVGANDIYVDGLHGPITTIQGGLDDAMPGDTVYVRGGEYNGQIDWTSSDNDVSVVGLGDPTIIGGAPLRMDGVSNGRLVGISFRGVTFLVTGNSSNCSIERCRFYDHNITGNGGALRLVATQSISVSHCVFHDITGVTGGSSNQAAFHSAGTNTGNIIKNCTFVRCFSCIGFDGNSGPLPSMPIRNCVFYYNNAVSANYEPTYSCFFAGTPGPPAATNIYVDPEFIDPLADVFFLRPGSQALTGGQDGALIGALGQAFHSSHNPAMDVPDFMMGAWESWVVSDGMNALSILASPLVELNMDNEVILEGSTISAAIYSPVFDSGSGYTVVRSIDITAIEDLTLSAGMRQIIDFNASTPDREIRLRASQSPLTGNPADFNDVPSEVHTFFNRVAKSPPIRARYMQLELVLRHDGD